MKDIIYPDGGYMDASGQPWDSKEAFEAYYASPFEVDKERTWCNAQLFQAFSCLSNVLESLTMGGYSSAEAEVHHAKYHLFEVINRWDDEEKRKAILLGGLGITKECTYYEDLGKEIMDEQK